MERKDLLGLNALIFRDQGIALNEVANRNVKVIVVGNPANTNTLICSHYAPNIPKENFTALTRFVIPQYVLDWTKIEQDPSWPTNCMLRLNESTTSSSGGIIVPRSTLIYRTPQSKFNQDCFRGILVCVF